MMSFPVGVHDDAVDALGLVGQLIDKMMAGKALPEPEIEDDGGDGFYIKAPALVERKRR